MAGIKFPPGVLYLQPVVHVDDPKIVSKYEAMAEKAALEAGSRVASIQYDLDEALREKTLLEKKLTERDADLLAMANLKNTEVVAQPRPDQEESKQLRLSVARLKEELAAAYRTMRELQEKTSEPKVIKSTERIVEYRDKIITKLDRRGMAWIGLVGLLCGLFAGYVISRPNATHQSPVGAEPAMEIRKK